MFLYGGQRWVDFNCPLIPTEALIGLPGCPDGDVGIDEIRIGGKSPFFRLHRFVVSTA